MSTVYDGIGRTLGTDSLHIRDELSETELDYLERARRFVDDELLPAMACVEQLGAFALTEPEHG
jgi:hypothetical protein